MKKAGCLVMCALLAGFLAAGAKAASQGQPVQPQKPVQPDTPPPSGVHAPAKKPAAPLRAYDRALLHPAALKDQAPAEYRVKFSTTKGDFTVTVTRAWAPLGADRFYNLVKHHFFDEASFFRVHPGFVVQFGISGYPPVAAAWKEANIKDDPVTQSNRLGYLTFATAGKDTRTTQVFINLADNKRLDNVGFAAFAQVTEGMHVVESLYAGYGEGAPDGTGPDQDEIAKQGSAYLAKGWPRLDSIKTAVLLATAQAPAAKTPRSAASKPR